VDVKNLVALNIESRAWNIIDSIRDENFPGIPGNLGFSSDFRVFSRVGVPHLRKKKNCFFLVKMTPQFIVSTLKCNSVTPKALNCIYSP
jgi:hypothetical protein